MDCIAEQFFYSWKIKFERVKSITQFKIFVLFFLKISCKDTRQSEILNYNI